jgi:hypothetical protein
MKWIIIDSVPIRAEKLQQKLSLELQVNANHIRFLDDNSKPEQETLYLIHNSDGYVDDFTNKSKLLKNTFVVFYSGGGLSQSNLKSTGKSIGFFSSVFQNGDEEDFFLLLNKLKEIFNNNKDNKKKVFQHVFEYDSKLESHIEPFRTVNPFTVNIELQEAKKSLNKYINSKP